MQQFFSQSRIFPALNLYKAEDKVSCSMTPHIAPMSLEQKTPQSQVSSTQPLTHSVPHLVYAHCEDSGKVVLMPRLVQTFTYCLYNKYQYLMS